MTIASKCSFGKGQGIWTCNTPAVRLAHGWSAEAGLGHEEQNMEATLQQKEQEARERVQALEDRLCSGTSRSREGWPFCEGGRGLSCQEREKAVQGSGIGRARSAARQAIKKSTLLREVHSTKSGMKVMEDLDGLDPHPREDCIEEGPVRAGAHFLLSGIQRIDVGRRDRSTGRTPGRRRGVERRADRVETCDRGGSCRAAPPRRRRRRLFPRRRRRRPRGWFEDPPFVIAAGVAPPSEAEAPGVAEPRRDWPRRPFLRRSAPAAPAPAARGPRGLGSAPPRRAPGRAAGHCWGAPCASGAAHYSPAPHTRRPACPPRGGSSSGARSRSSLPSRRRAARARTGRASAAVVPSRPAGQVAVASVAAAPAARPADRGRAGGRRLDAAHGGCGRGHGCLPCPCCGSCSCRAPRPRSAPAAPVAACRVAPVTTAAPVVSDSLASARHSSTHTKTTRGRTARVSGGRRTPPRFGCLDLLDGRRRRWPEFQPEQPTRRRRRSAPTGSLTVVGRAVQGHRPRQMLACRRPWQRLRARLAFVAALR